MAELRRVIAEFGEVQLRESLLQSVEKAEYFLKGVFPESHIGKDDIGFHSCKFALENGDGSTHGSRAIECNGCLAPFAVLLELERIIPPSRQDAKQVITDCRENFVQYYAHLHRVKMQQIQIARTVNDIVTNRKHERVVMLADYKMKFEPLRYGEQTVQFFGKKGISWHGVVVFYLPYKYDDEGNYIGGEELSTLFYDRIINGDTKQDVGAVTSLLEAAMMRVRIDLPSVKEIILLSDNAGFY